ncbi:hypothetical protein [Winogradskyella tangerina]|uniref:hypothetical protein n=1 Tax=Winogradskyella tangerina TaxID=2023240 RepID=UPI000DBE9A8E|nr:hypothetical protein [Winogradskyella tangerina]
MKIFSIVILALVTIVSSDFKQETKLLTATYDGFEDGIFYFTDSVDEDETYEFEKIEDGVLKTFDLKDKKFEGKTFNISYTIETKTDETEDEYEIWTIVKLELVK